jgi:hypothetical protein
MGNAIISSVGLGNFRSIRNAAEHLVVPKIKYFPNKTKCDIIRL